MSIDCFRRSSISKQRGAEMSSRLMPPKVGAISSTAWTISSASWVARQIGKASTLGELLEQHRLALHHRHRGLGPDVAEAEHGAAVGDDGDRVLLDRVLERLGAVGVDLLADPRDAGRVGHREVVAGLQRVLVALLDLAAAVHLHRAVGVLEDLGAAGGPDPPQDLLPVRLVTGVDRELAHPLALARRRRAPGRRPAAARRPRRSRPSACPAAPAERRARRGSVTLYWALTDMGRRFYAGRRIRPCGAKTAAVAHLYRLCETKAPHEITASPRLAARQHGVITVRQLECCGIDRTAIGRRIADGTSAPPLSRCLRARASGPEQGGSLDGCCSGLW